MFQSLHVYNFLDYVISYGGAVLLSGTTAVCPRNFGESWCVGNYGFFYSELWFLQALFLILLWISSFYYQSLACWISSFSCWLQLWLAWWWNVNHTCYPYCYFLLASLSLRYEYQYHRKRSMVMIWCYMAQMGIKEQLTWQN